MTKGAREELLLLLQKCVRYDIIRVISKTAVIGESNRLLDEEKIYAIEWRCI